MVFSVAIAFLFIIEGLRRTSRFIILVFQWKQSQEWNLVQGKVIQSDLQSVLVPGGGRRNRLHINIDGSVRLVTAYIPNIVYEYRVNAKSFQSKQIFLGQQFPSSLNFSINFVEKYPTGKDVTVYYNPEKPETAVLERDRFKELFGYLGGDILFLLLGLAILIQIIRG